jgi:hypothetical protein
MPRRSADSYLTPVLDVARVPLEPRAELDPKVAEVFRELVASVAPGHFQPCDRPVVEALATAIYIARQAQDGLAAADWGTTRGQALARLLREQSKAISMMATRLRLTPQSRMSKDKASGTARGGEQDLSWLGSPDDRGGDDGDG